MQNPFTHCSEQHRVDAVAELRAELADFSHDGLVQLIEDLKQGAVSRGTWTGCVISYKRGSAGSARRDRFGRARNPFTILWDNGWITDEEVVALARTEMAARRHKAALQVCATKRRYEIALQNCARRRASALSGSL